jgi:hypothetical protein
MKPVPAQNVGEVEVAADEADKVAMVVAAADAATDKKRSNKMCYNEPNRNHVVWFVSSVRPVLT